MAMAGPRGTGPLPPATAARQDRRRRLASEARRLEAAGCRDRPRTARMCPASAGFSALPATADVARRTGSSFWSRGLVRPARGRTRSRSIQEPYSHTCHPSRPAHRFQDTKQDGQPRRPPPQHGWRVHGWSAPGRREERRPRKQMSEQALREVGGGGEGVRAEDGA